MGFLGPFTVQNKINVLNQMEGEDGLGPIVKRRNCKQFSFPAS